jgi:hypothetical protein
MVGFMPRGAGILLMRALQMLPNRFMWWDPRIKERQLPVYGYPGFWTHCLAQSVFAGAEIFADATQRAPRAATCTVVVNGQDPAVNNAVASELVTAWQHQGAAYGFTVWNGLGKLHDIIDPSTYPAARTRVYPHLAALLDA